MLHTAGATEVPQFHHWSYKYGAPHVGPGPALDPNSGLKSQPKPNQGKPFQSKRPRPEPSKPKPRKPKPPKPNNELNKSEANENPLLQTRFLGRRSPHPSDIDCVAPNLELPNSETFDPIRESENEEWPNEEVPCLEFPKFDSPRVEEEKKGVDPGIFPQNEWPWPDQLFEAHPRVVGRFEPTFILATAPTRAFSALLNECH